MDEHPKAAPSQEPLPIWFFVGMILLVYGLIILGSGLLSTPPRPTVLAEMRPALWWGGLTALAGVVFLGIGILGPQELPMRSVQTRAPSFPEASPDTLLASEAGVRWQVLCGDRDHWRAGLYSPDLGSLEEIHELERHDCPELFLLLSGALTLVLADPGAPGGVRELPLELGRPVLVSAPHSGFCPGGPGSGRAFVVERDSFDTEYRPASGWR